MTTAVQRGLAPVRRVLANGLTVIAKQSRATPAVTINAGVRAGSACDLDDRVGLSYFASRVLDRGAEGWTAEAIAEDLDNRGVSLQMSVNRHLVMLVTTCLVEDFEPVLRLVGDILMRPTFPPREVDTRRVEIVTAIRQDEDNPAVVATEGVMSLLYPGHPYGRRSKGTIESIDAIDRAALSRFHHERFGPDNVSLVVVGDVEPERAVDTATRVFGDWAVAALPEPPLAPAPRSTRRQRVVRSMMNKSQADIAYGFTTVARRDPAYYPLWVMNTMLGQYALGGRLGDSIRERQGMAYYAFSTVDPGVVEGPLTIRAGVSPDNVDRAVDAIDAEVARMADAGLTPDELDEGKRFLVGSLPRTLETNPAIASFLQGAEYFGLGLDLDLRLPERFNAVTLDEVREVASRLLAPEHAAVAIAGPYRGNEASPQTDE